MFMNRTYTVILYMRHNIVNQNIISELSNIKVQYYKSYLEPNCMIIERKCQ